MPATPYPVIAFVCVFGFPVLLALSGWGYIVRDSGLRKWTLQVIAIACLTVACVCYYVELASQPIV